MTYTYVFCSPETAFLANPLLNSFLLAGWNISVQGVSYIKPGPWKLAVEPKRLRRYGTKITDRYRNFYRSGSYHFRFTCHDTAPQFLELPGRRHIFVTAMPGRKVTLAKDRKSKTVNVLGFLLRFLTTPEDIDDAICAMHVTFLPEIVMPLHSHGDAEIVYVLEGSIEVFQDAGYYTEWRTISAGDTVSILKNEKHAIRNTSLKPATCILVIGREQYRFVCEVSKPFAPHRQPLPPTLEEVEYFLEAAPQYGLWFASPEENEAIGLLAD